MNGVKTHNDEQKLKPKKRKHPGKISTSEWQVSADPVLWFAPANELRRLKPWFLSEKKKHNR